MCAKDYTKAFLTVYCYDLHKISIATVPSLIFNFSLSKKNLESILDRQQKGDFISCGSLAIGVFFKDIILSPLKAPSKFGPKSSQPSSKEHEITLAYFWLWVLACSRFWNKISHCFKSWNLVGQIVLEYITLGNKAISFIFSTKMLCDVSLTEGASSKVMRLLKQLV